MSALRRRLNGYLTLTALHGARARLPRDRRRRRHLTWRIRTFCKLSPKLLIKSLPVRLWSGRLLLLRQACIAKRNNYFFVRFRAKIPQQLEKCVHKLPWRTTVLLSLQSTRFKRLCCSLHGRWHSSLLAALAGTQVRTTLCALMFQPKIVVAVSNGLSSLQAILTAHPPRSRPPYHFSLQVM